MSTPPLYPTHCPQETIQGALNTQLVTASDEIVSIYHRRLEYGYPTPSLDRDAVLAEAIPLLQSKGIWSRGRFGSYKYEVYIYIYVCEHVYVCLSHFLMSLCSTTLFLVSRVLGG